MLYIDLTSSASQSVEFCLWLLSTTKQLKRLVSKILFNSTERYIINVREKMLIKSIFWLTLVIGIVLAVPMYYKKNEQDKYEAGDYYYLLTYEIHIYVLFKCLCN